MCSSDLRAAVADHSLTVTVDDDGPGIPPELRADAFRPFVRLDNARNLDETGTGLGLAIALDIARAHGGDLTLIASDASGAVFRFALRNALVLDSRAAEKRVAE